MENDIKQRAEQLKKNAETKIQKAQTKEQKYQQDLEFQKKNNPNFRDYDENPLIIQSYEEFFVLVMFMSSLMLSGMFFYICKDLYKGFSMNISEYISGFVIICLYILIISIFQKTHFSKHKIKFTNRYIEFYDYGKLKKQCEIDKNKIFRPFSERCSNGFDFTDFILLCLFVITIIITKGFILLIAVFYYISHLLIKFFIYLFLNKNLKGFSIFPFIIVSNESVMVSGYGAVFSARYFLVYLYSYKIYKEIKQYFLQQGINIDDLPKKYSIF